MLLHTRKRNSARHSGRTNLSQKLDDVVRALKVDGINFSGAHERIGMAITVVKTRLDANGSHEFYQLTGKSFTRDSNL